MASRNTGPGPYVFHSRAAGRWSRYSTLNLPAVVTWARLLLSIQDRTELSGCRRLNRAQGAKIDTDDNQALQRAAFQCQNRSRINWLMLWGPCPICPAEKLRELHTDRKLCPSPEPAS